MKLNEDQNGYVISVGSKCVQVADKYFRIYSECTNYQPYMWEQEYSHLRNIVEKERKEISKEEYKAFQLGPGEPLSHTEPPENYS